MAAAFLQLASSAFFRQNQYNQNQHHPLFTATSSSASMLCLCCSRSSLRIVALVGKGDTELGVSQENEQLDQEEEDEEEQVATPEDLEYIAQINRVLELLWKNRDMLFSEVKLTVMIEDPREAERRRLLGIEDSDTPTRDDLAEALEQVNEGKVPKNRVALRMLAEEMIQWPNLEVEATKKTPRKSLYAIVTDTGIDPEVAAKRLNVD